MGMPNLRNVRQAIRAHFVDELRERIPESRISWENRPFVPPNDGDFWIRESTQVILEHHPAFELNWVEGRTAFDVFYPAGAKTNATERVEDLQQLIADAYEKRQSLTNNGTIVGISSVRRTSGEKTDDAWWMASVSIYWRTYSPATSILEKI
jgi:hypothetical protein